MAAVVELPTRSMADQTTTRSRRQIYAKVVWWVVFIGLLIGALLIGGTGYRHGLGYIDYPDEVTIWTMGRSYVDPTWPMFQPEYPPGILVISSLIQRFQGEAQLNPARTIEVQRFTSVLAFTLTTALLALLGYRLSGPVAGAMAGLFWLALPLANYHAKYATIDAWLCFWFVASMCAAVEGWRRKAVGWIAFSLILAIIATLFKWQGAAALGAAGLACLTFWRTERRRAILLMVAYVVIVGVFGYWVVVIHRALEGGVYLPGTETHFPTPQILLANIGYQLTAFASTVIYGVLAMIGLLLPIAIPDLRRRLYGGFMLWMLPVVIVAFLFVISFNGAPVYDRHYLAGLALQSLLAGLGVALIVQIILRVRVRLVQIGAIAALGVVIGMPVVQMLEQSIKANTEFLRPDRRAAFAEWARTTATEGPLLITDPYVAAAVQTLYGYQGRPLETPYNQGTSVYVDADNITQSMLTDKGIRYIVTNGDFKGEHMKLPVTRLIAYAGEDSTYRGNTWAVYYVGALPLFPPEEVVVFGDEVELRGYSLSTMKAEPGDTIDMRLFWGASRQPTRYYSYFLHLRGEQTGELSAPINGQVPVTEDRPTISWGKPDEILMSPVTTWTVPTDAPPGDYELLIGLFEPLTQDYLRLPDGKHYHVMAKITILPQ